MRHRAWDIRINYIFVFSNMLEGILVRQHPFALSISSLGVVRHLPQSMILIDFMIRLLRISLRSALITFIIWAVCIVIIENKKWN